MDVVGAIMFVLGGAEISVAEVEVLEFEGHLKIRLVRSRHCRLPG